MWKFADLFDELQNFGLITTGSMHQPDEPRHEWFEAVHCPVYYRSFLEGKLGPDQERRIGFGELTREAPLIRRTLLECSGTIKTVSLALRYGLAVNLAGGTHHAHRNFGSGFTILNDLAVAASWALSHTHVRRIAIVDLDVHQGDGTAAIFKDNPQVFTMSMHCGANFPFRKQISDMDIDVPRGTGDRAYLELLQHALAYTLAQQNPDLVLYDAGVDVYEKDELGFLKLSHAGIYMRDRYVIDTCVAARIPIACVIGGGYDRNRKTLARRHALIHRAAAHVWRDHALGGDIGY